MSDLRSILSKLARLEGFYIEITVRVVNIGLCKKPSIPACIESIVPESEYFRETGCIVFKFASEEKPFRYSVFISFGRSENGYEVTIDIGSIEGETILELNKLFRSKKEAFKVMMSELDKLNEDIRKMIVETVSRFLNRAINVVKDWIEYAEAIKTVCGYESIYSRALSLFKFVNNSVNKMVCLDSKCFITLMNNEVEVPLDKKINGIIEIDDYRIYTGFGGSGATLVPSENIFMMSVDYNTLLILNHGIRCGDIEIEYYRSLLKELGIDPPNKPSPRIENRVREVCTKIRDLIEEVPSSSTIIKMVVLAKYFP